MFMLNFLIYDKKLQSLLNSSKFTETFQIKFSCGILIVYFFYWDT